MKQSYHSHSNNDERARLPGAGRFSMTFSHCPGLTCSAATEDARDYGVMEYAHDVQAVP